ncbi:hypothetical protein VT99_11662 [Candidatus Electrothrix marina]|uniref:DUF3012 domain-containing protein n=1 Tax=Candidatus Electrothrix marina TaxID=1859130 RepID=A0A444J2J0_9BACT|nr:hypothetical protein VT99_11662 [Candidatus Electrothrix marina]
MAEKGIRQKGGNIYSEQKQEKKMKLMKKIVCGVVLVGAAVMMSGCLATVGSERWCQNMRDKPKTDWSAGEAVDFAKHCIIK